MALAYLFQYVLGMFTLTAATTFAIEWIYGDDDGVPAADVAAAVCGDNGTWCLCNATPGWPTDASHS